MEGCFGAWGRNPQPPEAIGGLGAKPQLPEAGGLVAKPPALENFAFFLQKSLNLRAILIKNMLLKCGIDIGNATWFNWLH